MAISLLKINNFELYELMLKKHKTKGKTLTFSYTIIVSLYCNDITGLYLVTCRHRSIYDNKAGTNSICICLKVKFRI